MFSIKLVLSLYFLLRQFFSTEINFHKESDDRREILL